jgi:hypothetical protein
MMPSAFAAGKPDFSGEWKLNVARSDFGAVPPPSSQTMKIDHKDPALKVVSTQIGAADGDTTMSATYSTDGKETKNDYRGAPLRSVANWDGGVLVINTKVDFQGATSTIKATWKLSDDGKTLTVNTSISTPQGAFDIKSVFEKAQ